MWAPIPSDTKAGTVVLADIPLVVVPGTYEEGEAKGFAEKISTGALSYADLAPYRSSHAQSTWAGGYGLRRFSDLQSSSQAATMYLEGMNVETSEDGVVFNGPEVVQENLPWISGDTQGHAVWFGEFSVGSVLYFVCVAGSVVFRRTGGGTWERALSLPAVARAGAVGAFGNKLIIGYGSSRTAQYTTDLSSLLNVTDSAGASLYVFAFTSDRADAFIAGGTSPNDIHKVMSSTDGGTGYASSITCGSPSSAITALAPGGSTALLFVGKETELGMITTGTAVYKVLVPFDTKMSTNCLGMRWYMSRGEDEQRGPLVLVFPRDRSLWAYVPKSNESGEARNISPWGMPGRRPLTAKGRVTAIQGSARFLYVAVLAQDGTWVLKIDQRTGAPHTWLYLQEQVHAMGITSSSGVSQNPVLFLGLGSSAVYKTGYVVLPMDGESAIDDPSCRFAPLSVLDTPDIDFGFPNENKIVFDVSVVADNLAKDQRVIDVHMSRDGGSYSFLGTISESPSQSIEMSGYNSVKRLGLRFFLKTSTSTSCPHLRAYVVRASITPKVYRTWNFQARIPSGRNALGADDLQNAQDLVVRLREARATGTPITFVDVWNDLWSVVVLDFSYKIQSVEVGRPPQLVASLSLLEFSPSAEAAITYAAPRSNVLFFPIFPMLLHPSTLDVSDTISVPGSSNSYPTWVVYGPGETFILENTSYGQEMKVNHELLPGHTVTVSTKPGSTYVVDQDGVDLTPKVVPGSTYWPLRPGNNSIRVRLYRTNGDSKIVMKYLKGGIAS